MTTSFHAQSAFQRFVSSYSQDTRRLIVFCGAGASLEAGLPDWDGLIAKLEAEFHQPIHGSLGDAILRKRLDIFHEIKDPWEKVQFAEDFLGNSFQIAIESIISADKNIIPTFYRKIWDLKLSGLVTMNLDGLAKRGYPHRKDGAVPEVYTGREAFHARNVFTSKIPSIIELHGNINKPNSWVLTKNSIDSIFQMPGYVNFLRGIFSDNLVLMYGISEGDASVTAQLRYLNEIKSASGQYFCIKRMPASQSDRDNSTKLGISYIYLPEDKTWENGFSLFIEEVKKFRQPEPEVKAVTSALAKDDTILPDAKSLMLRDPDEVRVLLAKSTKNLFGDPADLSKIKSFRSDYDLAINHASRVKLGTDNSRWLNYNLVSERGFGNFGKVFEAYGEDGSHVAVKIAHESVRDNENMLDSFRRGVESMRMLTADDVSGIVRIIDATELPPSIIMEFVDGISLEEAVNQGVVATPFEALNVLKFISNIIFRCHTHSRGVLHRDLRPQNIMIGGSYWERVEESNISVLDFDLSWYDGAAGEEYYMAPGNSLGYLSPEQLNPDSNTTSRNALVDVYGLAMLLFFVLSKQHPQAAAPEKANWETRVSEAVSQVYNQRWTIVGKYVSKIISNGACAKQKDRPKLSDFVDQISIAIRMLKGEFIDDPKILLSELANRSFSVFMDPSNKKSASGSTLTGVSVEFSNDIQSNSFVIKLNALANDSANRQSIGRYLAEGLEKAKAVASSLGEIDKKGTLTGQSRNQIEFSVKCPRNFEELNSLSAGLMRIANLIKIN